MFMYCTVHIEGEKVSNLRIKYKNSFLLQRSRYQKTYLTVYMKKFMASCACWVLMSKKLIHIPYCIQPFHLSPEKINYYNKGCPKKWDTNVGLDTCLYFVEQRVLLYRSDAPSVYLFCLGLGLLKLRLIAPLWQQHSPTEGSP